MLQPKTPKIKLDYVVTAPTPRGQKEPVQYGFPQQPSKNQFAGVADGIEMSTHFDGRQLNGYREPKMTKDVVVGFWILVGISIGIAVCTLLLLLL